MTSDDIAQPGRPRSLQTYTALSPEQTETVLALLADAARTDGQQAVSEQGRLQLRGGEREGVSHLLLSVDGELVGYAQLEDTDPVEPPAAELVVHPSHRGNGHGRALGSALLAASGKRLRVWAHGGHSAARHLAQVLGLTLFRELRQMRRPLSGLDLPDPVLPEGVTVRTFVPGRDDAAWLAVNAAAFAHHPEQGSLTQRDLDDRKAEPWFDPEGFFLAERAGEEGRIVGFPLDQGARRGGPRRGVRPRGEPRRAGRRPRQVPHHDRAAPPGGQGTADGHALRRRRQQGGRVRLRAAGLRHPRGGPDVPDGDLSRHRMRDRTDSVPPGTPAAGAAHSGTAQRWWTAAHRPSSGVTNSARPSGHSSGVHGGRRGVRVGDHGRGRGTRGAAVAAWARRTGTGRRAHQER
ncbi:mycothiol synthase [Streptomyces calvus]